DRCDCGKQLTDEIGGYERTPGARRASRSAKCCEARSLISQYQQECPPRYPPHALGDSGYQVSAHNYPLDFAPRGDDALGVEVRWCFALVSRDRFAVSWPAEREAISRRSTWPWEAATLTGFLTTLVLPGLLWLVQHLLGRLGL